MTGVQTCALPIYILFRAVDNAGNERIVRISAPSGFSPAVYAALVTGAFFLLLAGGMTFLHHKETKHRKAKK